ncbi:MAG: SDR family oxidoreductase [Rhizobiales bacterium]|nr:SDR family oxidoreductase [Hyphomicrobiales bacterium]
MKSVVITGASTGIGETAAKYLVAQGFKVYGSVRKPEDGARLKQEIGGNFEPLIFDVTDEAAIKLAAEKVRADLNGRTLDGLVNNAGIAVPGPFLETSLDKWRKQFETNVVGLVAATQAFAPLLGADLSLKGEPGRIVMISSVAGKRGNPFAGPYSASKHAVEGLSEALRREMMLFGIDVIVIGPGPIRTPIWGKGAAPDFSKLGNSPYAKPLEAAYHFMQNLGKNGLPPEDVARLIHHALTGANVKTRYTITPGWFTRAIFNLLPVRMSDRIVARRLKIERLRP